MLSLVLVEDIYICTIPKNRRGDQTLLIRLRAERKRLEDIDGPHYKYRPH